MPEFRALLGGYARFRAARYTEERERFDRLEREGQHPPIMIVSCCDSRVDPTTIFDTAPGQTFVVRNVAAMVPPYDPGPGHRGTSAAIEYGVRALEVRHLVVMGHGRCGGVAASLAGVRHHEGHSFLDDWIALIAPARAIVMARAPADPQRALEEEAVRLSLANLRQFPFVAEREAAGALKLHGCWFAIAEGALWVLDEASGEFRLEQPPSGGGSIPDHQEQA